MVPVKKKKEIDSSDGPPEEFEREVTTLEKFRCDFIVHFYGACFIQKHILKVTEFAPCGSLIDCVKKRPVPDDQSK